MSIFTNKIPDIINNIYQSLYILENIDNIDVEELSEEVGENFDNEKLIEHLTSRKEEKERKAIETEKAKEKNIHPYALPQAKQHSIIKPLVKEKEEKEEKQVDITHIINKPKQTGGNNLIDFDLL